MKCWFCLRPVFAQQAQIPPKKLKQQKNVNTKIKKTSSKLCNTFLKASFGMWQLFTFIKWLPKYSDTSCYDNCMCVGE